MRAQMNEGHSAIVETRPTWIDRLGRLLGLLVLLTTAVLALTREADRPVDTLVARWAPPPSDFIDLDGQLVHLRDTGPRGDPVPIVLLHGTSASLHTWSGWQGELSKTRRVITFDLPGFGLTGPRADHRYGGDDDARFTLDLLDRLKVGRFVVGGNSLGGGVAWRVATLAPERVDRLILVAASGLPDTVRDIPLGWRIARTPVLGKVAEWTLPRAMVAQGLTQAHADPAQVTPALVDRYFELTLREGNRAALRRRLEQFVQGADAQRIAGIRQPTLILWGELDRVLAPAAADEFERRIAGSRKVKFPRLGHVPQEEDATGTLVPVKEFLGLP
jgi:pimeloyl-ACP methyl ester carboxylesterase